MDSRKLCYSLLMLMALVAFGAIGDVIVIIDQTDDLLKRMRAIL